MRFKCDIIWFDGETDYEELSEYRIDALTRNKDVKILRIHWTDNVIEFRAKSKAGWPYMPTCQIVV